ncbi:MAG: DNA-binding protein [Pseudomonadota bacterium]
MNRESFVAAPSPRSYSLSTKEFADLNLVKAQTVLKQHSTTGSYFGVRPLPLPNRKLLWPDDSIQQLLAEKLQTGSK